MGSSATTAKQVSVYASDSCAITHSRCVFFLTDSNTNLNLFIFFSSLHSVTVQCTRNGQFVVVVARDATEPKLDVDSVSLLNSEGSSCSVVDYTASFAVFQFPVTECGTVVKEVGASVMQQHKEFTLSSMVAHPHNFLPRRRKVTLCMRTT